MYSRADLEKLAEVIRKGSYLIVCDDIYHKLVYDGERFTSLLAVAPDLADRVIIINGVSKTYSMTGWRLGYALGPAKIITAMENIQSQSTSNPTSFVQRAAAAALTGDQGCVEEMRKVFEGRRNHIVSMLNAIPGVSCGLPKGAFYAFPNVKGLFGKKTRSGETLTGSMNVASWLINEARIAVIPGGPFGADENLRLSYATSDAKIEEGLKRFSEAVSKLS